MDEKNINTEKLQKLLDQIEEQNNRIAKLEKLVSEKFEVKKEKTANYYQRAPEPAIKHAWPEPAPSKPFDWQWAELALGKYGLQVVGIIIFLLGMGFLLKYSIEMGWFTPTLRVAAGLVMATGLLAGAELWRQRFKGWANGIMAGGIVLYYFSFYAAHNFYELISINTAFGAFIAVTILAGTIALVRNSLLIGVFSLVGGYLTPLFLSAAVSPNVHMLSVYLSILAISFFVIAYIKEWFALPIISFIFLIFYYAITLRDALSFNGVLLFLTFVGIVHSILPYVYVLIAKPKQRFFEPWLIALSGSSLFFALFEYISAFKQEAIIQQLLNNPTSSAIFKYQALAFGTLYLLGYVGLYFRDKTNKYLLKTISSLFALWYVSAIVIHFYGYNLIMAMQVFGLLLFMAGILLSASYLRTYAYAVWMSAMARLVVLYYTSSFGDVHIIFNVINASILVITTSFALAAYAAYHFKKRLDGREEYIPGILASGVLMTIFYWLHTAIWQSPYHIVGIMVYASILFFAGIFKYRALRYFAYSFWAIGLAHFGFTFFARHLLQPAHALELHLLYLLCVTTFVVSYYCVHRFAKHFQHDEKSKLLTLLSTAISLLGLSWGHSAIILHYEGAYANAQSVALTIFYGLYALVLITIGLFKQKHLLRYLGLALIAITMGKLWFIIMAMNDTVYRIITFIVVGVLFLVISVAYQQLSKRITK